MRFLEKTFEIRFCAAFSAALMPFNRNPQWLGLTQAQERKAGFDSMLRMGGGRLFIFQFKAKNQRGKFLLEKDQWTDLSAFRKKNNRSAYYVFPDISTIFDVNATINCLMKNSWCCTVDDLKPFFLNFTGQTRTLSLFPCPGYSCLEGGRVPGLCAQVKTVCDQFGCFCDKYCINKTGTTPSNEIEFLAPGGLSRLRHEYGSEVEGVPIGDSGKDPNGDGHEETKPILYFDQFEEMFGNSRKRDLKPGLIGLFLPHEDAL